MIRSIGGAAALGLGSLSTLVPHGHVPALFRPALSSQADIAASVKIPGHRAVYAVSYRLHGSYLSVIWTRGHGAHFIWRERVPSPAAVLTTPGPAGLFQGMIKSKGRARILFAYNVQLRQVHSAIAGHPSGEITGSEGASTSGLQLTLRKPDTAHVGSVRYRLETHYRWSRNLYRLVRTNRVPDYAKNAYPHPNAVDRTSKQDVILIRLEVADTEQKRETGLMNRQSLDPDSGMIFVWPEDTHSSFWMENTYIPLTVAFTSAQGRIQEMQDMEPLSLALHTPSLPYRYAIEVNQGFFGKNGIRVGDKLSLNLNP